MTETTQPGDPATDPSAAVQASELRTLFEEASAGLSDRDRAVLELQLRHGLEGRDLADAMGMDADASYVVVSRLRDQVERALGALLVARQGRDGCEDLDRMLEPWDGRFSPLWRKRVARHVDGCEACSTTRARVLSPAALLGAIPLVAPPADLRDRVLGDLELVSHRGTPWPVERGGFPPGEGEPRHHVAAWWSVAAGLVALALVLGVIVLGGGSGDTDAVAVLDVDAVDGDPAPAPAGPRTTRAPRGAPGPGSGPPAGEEPEPDPGPDARAVESGAGDLPAGAAPPAEPAPATGAPDAGPMASPATTAAPGPSTTGSTTTTTTRPTPTTSATTTTTSTTTTTGPPDRTGPTFGTVQVDPPRIFSSVRGQGCGSQPTSARVSVGVTDPSGVTTVVLSWGGPDPGTETMVRSGDSYVATVGDLSAPGLASGQTTTVPLTIRADDAAGNRSTTTGSLTLIGC